MYRQVRSYKLAEERSKGTSHGPEPDWVEEEFVAAVCIFFPAGEFVIDVQRHTLFEAITLVGGEPNPIACAL
jgi:hypothetical protein